MIGVHRALASLTTQRAAIGQLQAQIDRWCLSHPAPRVLDAGCGTARRIQLGPEARVLGVDIDASQLERNAAVHERIVGDIQAIELEPGAFDLILCWDVLEHVRRPRAAIENLRRGLADGGLMVLAGPNPLSLKGLVAKMTPHRFHRAYYRRASTDEPFETYLSLDASPGRLSSWASRSGMIVVYLACYESEMQLAVRERVRLTGPLWAAIDGLVGLLSGGRFRPAATDFVLVLEKDMRAPAEGARARVV